MGNPSVAQDVQGQPRRHFPEKKVRAVIRPSQLENTAVLKEQIVRSIEARDPAPVFLRVGRSQLQRDELQSDQRSWRGASELLFCRARNGRSRPRFAMLRMPPSDQSLSRGIQAIARVSMTNAALPQHLELRLEVQASTFVTPRWRAIITVARARCLRSQKGAARARTRP